MPCSARSGKVPELDFAPLRPDFVAACMVEAARTRDGRRDRSGRPERCPPRCRAANGNREGCPLAGTRRSAARRVAVQGSPAAVPYPWKTDKWGIWPRLRKAFEEVFGAVRLSLHESATPLGTWDWLLWVTVRVYRVIYLDL